MNLTPKVTTQDMIFGIRLCQWAENPSAPRPDEVAGKVEDVSFIQRGHTQVVVCRWVDKSRPDRIVVAFPCTQGLLDILADMDAKMVDWEIEPGVKVGIHEGFHSHGAQVDAAVLQGITALFQRFGRLRVWTFGYSLGGALQTRMAAILSKSVEYEASGSAGSPRLWDSRGRDWFDRRVTDYARTVFGNVDPYTTVPQSELGGTRLFYGCGTEVRFHEHEVIVAKRRGWLSQAWHVFTRWASTKLGNPIDLRNTQMHAADRYVAAYKEQA